MGPETLPPIGQPLPPLEGEAASIQNPTAKKDVAASAAVIAMQLGVVFVLAASSLVLATGLLTFGPRNASSLVGAAAAATVGVAAIFLMARHLRRVSARTANGANRTSVGGLVLRGTLVLFLPAFCLFGICALSGL